jgi:hypothetical protein
MSTSRSADWFPPTNVMVLRTLFHIPFLWVTFASSYLWDYLSHHHLFSSLIRWGSTSAKPSPIRRTLSAPSFSDVFSSPSSASDPSSSPRYFFVLRSTTLELWTFLPSPIFADVRENVFA